MTLTNYLEDAFANTLRGSTNGTSFTAPSHIYIKLHTGDPGETATSNAAGNTTRSEVAFGLASGGVITTTADVSWTNVSTTETYSHFSGWDASTGGNALFYGALTASKSVNAGDSFTIQSGQLTGTLD